MTFKLKKPVKWVLVITISLVIMAATVPAAIWVTHTQTAQLGNDLARCKRSENTTTHKIIIQGDKLTPQNTNAKLCDKVVVTNLDSKDRVMSFGPHEHHLSYGGVSERLLPSGQNFTFTVAKPGIFLLHDHAQDEVEGTITVTK